MLALLSPPVVDVLAEEDGGYVLMLPPSAARKRLEALARLLAGEGETRGQGDWCE